MIALPTRLKILDKIVTVELKRSDRLAGGGRACWDGKKITVYYNDDTTDDEIVDTLYHEAIEVMLIGQGLRRTDDDGRVRYDIPHRTMDMIGRLCSDIFFAVNLG